MVANKFFITQIKRSLGFSKQRLLIIVISIFMGAAVSNAFLNIYFDIDNKMSRELKAYGANMVLSSSHEGNISLEDVAAVRKQLDVKKLIAFSPYFYFTPSHGSRQIMLAGVDFEEFRKINQFLIIKQGGAYDTRKFSEPDSIVLGTELAALLDKRLNQRLNLSFVQPSGEIAERTFIVRAIIETGDESDGLAFISQQAAMDFSGEQSGLSYVLITYDDDFSALSELASTLSSDEIELKTINSVSQREGAILQKIKGLMFLISIVILIISSTSVNTTLSSIIFSRKKEIALHISLGAAARDIIWLFASEVFILALFASLLGCAGGYALAQLLGKIIFAASIDFRASAFFAAVAISLIFAAAAAFLPIKKALSIDIIENLRGE